MDFLPDIPQLFVAVLGLFSACYLYYNWSLSKGSQQKATSAPQPPGAWPIIGHVHQLVSQTSLHRALGAMADKYGPIFMIRIGMNPVLMVNNWEGVKECFTTNDKAFASRPAVAVGKHLGYNYASIAFSPYGSHWRDTRKLITSELLSTRGLEKVKHLYISEVDIFIRELYTHCNSEKDNTTKVVISEMFDHLTMNSLTMMIMRKRYFGNTNNDDEAEKVRKVVKESVKAISLTSLSDIIHVPFIVPFIEWLDPQVRCMKRLAKDFDAVVQSCLDERQKKRSESNLEADHDFLDVLVTRVMEKKDGIDYEFSKETIIKSTMQILMFVGYETSSVTLTWIISLLLNNTDVLKCVQDELDQNVGKGRWVQESDIENLCYLQAVVKETLRLYPAGPLGFAHEAVEDSHVCGYEIPKGTRLLINIWKLHRDPRVWTSPNDFRPERFLTNQESFDLSGRCFELIPFGSGRRSCLGITLALRILSLTTARLLQGFNLSKTINGPLDMSESGGFTLCKIVPLEAILKPRLHPKMYTEM